MKMTPSQRLFFHFSKLVFAPASRMGTSSWTIGSILPSYSSRSPTLHWPKTWTESADRPNRDTPPATRSPPAGSDTQNVAWKRQLPGSGWSSPIHVDGRVYLTTADPADGPLSLRTLCLDASSGDTIWNKQVFSISDPKNIHNKNSNASPTPVFENGRLYIHSATWAPLASTSKAIPSGPTPDSPTHRHGNGGCPEISGDHLIFSCDGARDPFVVALDKNTGKIAWKKPRSSDAKKKFSFSTPLTIEVDGKKQLVTCGSNIVQALDPQTGEEIWHVNYTGYSVVPRPVFAHGLVYISTSFDNPVAMAIRPDGSGDVSETHVAWTAPKRAPNTPSTLVVGDEFYMVSDGGIGLLPRRQIRRNPLPGTRQRPGLRLPTLRRRPYLHPGRARQSRPSSSPAKNSRSSPKTTSTKNP